MKILLISFGTAWPLHFGERVPIYHLARELQARGHRLDLVAFADRPSDWHEQEHYAAFFGHVELIAEPERPAVLYTRRLNSPDSRWPRRADEAWSPAMWQAIERCMDAEQYDLVQLFGGPQVYEFFHALRGLPAVITPLDSRSLYLRRSLSQPNLSAMHRAERRAHWLITRAYEEWIFTRYDRTVVVSAIDRDELVSINPSLRVEVIPNGIDLDSYRLQPVRRDPATLVFVGSFDYEPNVDAALWLANEILPGIRERVPAARLWLVGKEPPPEIQALASESVTVTGFVPEVRPYLAQATAFVCPLRVGSGIKNKVLQALAMGCPVVATPLSVDGIAVTDGHDVMIADGDGLIDATVRLLQDAALREKFAVNGRALIEQRYTWSHVTTLYEALYADVQTGR